MTTVTFVSHDNGLSQKSMTCKKFCLSLFWLKHFPKPVITASDIQVEMNNKVILIQVTLWKFSVG